MNGKFNEDKEYIRTKTLNEISLLLFIHLYHTVSNFSYDQTYLYPYTHLFICFLYFKEVDGLSDIPEELVLQVLHQSV